MIRLYTSRLEGKVTVVLDGHKYRLDQLIKKAATDDKSLKKLFAAVDIQCKRYCYHYPVYTDAPVYPHSHDVNGVIYKYVTSVYFHYALHDVYCRSSCCGRALTLSRKKIGFLRKEEM